MKQSEIKFAVEAILFAAEDSLSSGDILKLIDEVDVELKEIDAVIDLLNYDYLSQNRAFTISLRAGGWQMVTVSDANPWMRKVFAKNMSNKLSQRAVETLSIIAYKQPITKLDIEEIRGVNSDGLVRQLIERDLITVIGRQKSPGSPMLYGTSKKFLIHFGLHDLNDLPDLKEINELLKTDEDLNKEIIKMSPEQLGLKFDQIIERSSNKLVSELDMNEEEVNLLKTNKIREENDMANSINKTDDLRENKEEIFLKKDEDYIKINENFLEDEFFENLPKETNEE